jgi:hypothetical protein
MDRSAGGAWAWDVGSAPTPPSSPPNKHNPTPHTQVRIRTERLLRPHHDHPSRVRRVVPYDHLEPDPQLMPVRVQRCTAICLLARPRLIADLGGAVAPSRRGPRTTSPSVRVPLTPRRRKPRRPRRAPHVTWTPLPNHSAAKIRAKVSQGWVTVARPIRRWDSYPYAPTP